MLEWYLEQFKILVLIIISGLMIYFIIRKIFHTAKIEKQRNKKV